MSIRTGIRHKMRALGHAPSHLMSGLRELQDIDDETRIELYRINLRRLLIIAFSVGSLVGAYAVIFWPFTLELDSVEALWRRHIGIAHLYFLAWWIVVAFATIAIRRLPVEHVAVKALQFGVPTGGLLFCVAVTVIDQAVTPNTSPFLIGSIAIGLLMLMSPAMAATVHAVGYSAFFFALPLTQHSHAVLLSNRSDGLTISVISVLLSIMLWRKDASVIMARKAIERKNEELKRAAEHDALTGVLSRAELLRRAGAQLLRARRRGSDISAVMLDLDHFKRINDVHGHQAGDAVLVNAARLMSRSVRDTDLVGRMGGEEFMIVLPDTNNKDAVGVANKLCSSMATAAFDLPGGSSIAVTASCGVSTIGSGSGRELEWLYASTDHALYEAKNTGRNRVSNAYQLHALSTSEFQRLR
ncbi:hypothetical protein GCM10007320_54120 [Pseudorhodoferax aquiterrae]|uniref:diguanylate cyclase n=1 Tax=Pseudorhodoferax aquiterrae TaxID=747304 RepID=A0ABQ3G947_9BURK|nr:GGDEF domain-containing protein [Pseudorhodoferax aquiterrae]GHC98431.1 hypothetical protein GCM10007320_54120 [Pseudorhodoferax aquiterrae]